MGNANLALDAEVEVHDGAHTDNGAPFYRRVLFQATVVGICAFLAPGLWNAMQSTGAGGQQSPYLVM
jgi:hypothetical protein